MGAEMEAERCVIKNADMPDDMVATALSTAKDGFHMFSVERDIAGYIKKEFDRLYEPTWHCVIGTSFGSYVSHETRRFIYFYYGRVAILLFKS